MASIDRRTRSKWKGGRYGNGQLVLLPDRTCAGASEEGELALVSATPDRFHRGRPVQGIEARPGIIRAGRRHPARAQRRRMPRSAASRGSIDSSNRLAWCDARLLAAIARVSSPSRRAARNGDGRDRRAGGSLRRRVPGGLFRGRLQEARSEAAAPGRRVKQVRELKWISLLVKTGGTWPIAFRDVIAATEKTVKNRPDRLRNCSRQPRRRRWSWRERSRG